MTRHQQADAPHKDLLYRQYDVPEAQFAISYPELYYDGVLNTCGCYRQPFAGLTGGLTPPIASPVLGGKCS